MSVTSGPYHEATHYDESMAKRLAHKLNLVYMPRMKFTAEKIVGKDHVVKITSNEGERYLKAVTVSGDKK